MFGFFYNSTQSGMLMLSKL